MAHSSPHATTAFQAHAPPQSHGSKNMALDDSHDAAIDEFRRHQQDVLAGRFRPDSSSIEGAVSDDADTESKYTVVLDPERRQYNLAQLETNAPLCLENFSRALRYCAGEVEEAMLYRRDIIRSFVAAGLVPRADDEDYEDCKEKVEVVLEALQEESRAKLGQWLVDQLRREGRLTAKHVVEYVRSRIASLVHRSAELTDTHVAAVYWAFEPKSEQQVLAQLERRLVEARYLDLCQDERSAPTTSSDMVPCCVYIRSKRLSLWRPFRRALPHNRDAVTVPWYPLHPWTLHDGIHFEYDVTMFPCRLSTPFHGTHVAVLACDWSVESSRRDGHPTFYLAKFITDYYLRVAALNAPTWREATYDVMKHIHQPILTDKYRALAYKFQDAKGMRTWSEDMEHLQLYTYPTASRRFPPSQQSPQLSTAMLALSDESPSLHEHDQDASVSSSQSQLDNLSNSVLLYHKQQEHLKHQEQLHLERHSFSCEDHRRRHAGLKRLRSHSQGPTELDDFAVDFELSIEPHRTSA